MKKAVLGLLTLAVVGAAGSFWVLAEPSSKARVTRDVSGKECTYDERGNLVRVVESAAPAPSTPLTGWDRMTRTIAPDGKPTTFEYETTHTFRVQKDAQGHEVRYQYDTEGNLDSVTESAR